MILLTENILKEKYGYKLKEEIIVMRDDEKDAVSWDDALSEAKRLGMRLPDIQELKQIYKTLKKDEKYYSYWSSTLDPTRPGYALFVERGGEVQSLPITTETYYILVK
jgi:hypothetical protein